jgi:dolichol-phosphate mannosyltransferase
MYPCPELCIVVPTFNESGNVQPLAQAIGRTLAGIAWELIFVDDASTDGTPEQVLDLARHDSRIRLIRRIGRRGLSSAVAEGALATTATYVAVMDADLQHDESLLPQMLDALKRKNFDLAVGSRTVGGGEFGAMTSQRQQLSRISSRITRRMIGSDVTDLMSGFFMMPRQLFHELAPNLSLTGFKILADLLASSGKPLRVKELPYQFRPRQQGESKLDARAGLGLVALLLDKTAGRWLPSRLLPFALVGGTGVVVHLAALWLLFQGLMLPFDLAQAMATLIAITSNYSFNNAFTYRDLQRRGKKWLTGLASFAAISGIGAAGNVGVASALYSQAFDWRLSALAGVAVGVLWNFTMTRVYTWRA